MNRQLKMMALFSGMLLCQASCHLFCQACAAAEASEVIQLWPEKPPGPERVVGEEQDITKPTDNLVAGRPIIKLANVSSPEIHIYRPPAEKRVDAAVVICPGGGFSILAWDLEGTEVAEWLNSMGITAVVLKYRVPTRDVEPKWLQPVQDAQRAISLVRSHAKDWQLNADRIGILGFSAGGHTAARAALMPERLYKAIDEADQKSCRPNAAMLIYPAYLSDRQDTALSEDLFVTKDSPRMFLVHAFDDRISAAGSLLLMLALKKAQVPSEIHLYDNGGHGYGLRTVDNQPVTTWPDRCADWLQASAWIR